MTTLQDRRAYDGATLQDEGGRYYGEDMNGKRHYGYLTHLAGAYVCYTCGHLCECGEEEL